MAWLSGWQYRILMKINVPDAGFIPRGVVPIKISTSAGISNQNLTDIFTKLGINSLKIAVTLPDGTTQCYCEVELWDNVNKIAILHAGIATKQFDEYMYLYYDNTQSDNTTYIGDITTSIPAKVFGSVWDDPNMHGDGASVIYHMNQDPSGGSECIKDSTGNNHGTPAGSMTSGDLVDTDFGKGLTLDGIDDLIAISGLTLSADNAFTVLARYKLADTDTVKSLLCRSDDNSIFNWKVDLPRSSTDLTATFRVWNWREATPVYNYYYYYFMNTFYPYYTSLRDVYSTASFSYREYGNYATNFQLPPEEEGADFVKYGNSPLYSFPLRISDATKDWHIGGEDTLSGQYFEGVITEFRFYNYELEQTEKDLFHYGYKDELIEYYPPSEYAKVDPLTISLQFTIKEAELCNIVVPGKQSLLLDQKDSSVRTFKSAALQRTDAVITPQSAHLASIFLAETISFLLTLKPATLFYVIDLNLNDVQSLLFSSKAIEVPMYGRMLPAKITATKSRIDCSATKSYMEITGQSSKILMEGV